ncbi:gliding motility-associated C-terminal domain-containing protein [Pontibacter vulgaris]|uniref:Ig-like domain-containing protein n=1 Tax=Pontibacter vulgaris TaxID=2905679 RepID=UPI001FA7DE81|nr:gliding motility-associated C-terminal domain-containing protein [Pontibacter vulgaris]
MRLLLPKLFYSVLFFLLLVSAGQAMAQANCAVGISTQSSTNFCQGGSALLESTNNFNATSWQWFRDGVAISDGTGTAATYTATQSGIYTVEASGPNCQRIVSAGRIEINVTPKPNLPTFAFDPNIAACAGTPINFFITSPETDVNYTWFFGDGTVEQGNPRSHTYTSVGTGTVTFRVKVIGTRNGCDSDTVSQIISVKQVPEVSFTEKNDFQVCIPDSVEPGDTAIFAEITNTTQAPFNTNIATYFVDWGDGKGEVTYPGQPNPFPLKNPTAYDTLGNYPIRIRAVSANGCEAIFEQVFKFSQEPKANFSLDKKRAEPNQSPGCIPVIVTPTDSSSGGDLSYEWSVQPDQGYELESGSLTGPDPVFRFTESGLYTIQLIVTNGCASDTTSQGIVVGYPQVQVPADVTECGPTTVDYSGSGGTGGGGPGGGTGLFIDENLGTISRVTITITGPVSTTQTFSTFPYQFNYNFTQPGTYKVSVEAVNECGSSNSIYQGQPAPAQTVIILPLPAKPTIQNPGIVCEGDTVRLAPTGPGPVYAWFDSPEPAALPVAISPTFTTPPLTGNVTYYVATIDVNNCGSPRTEVALTVRSRVTNNSIEGNEIVSLCKGETPAELKGSQPAGGDTGTPYAYTWERSTTGPTSDFTAAPGVNNTINYKPTEPVTTTTWFRRLVFSASCSADTSNVVEIQAVDPIPASANTISPAQEICAGDTPEPLIGSRPTGGAGGPYTFLWEVSTQGPDRGFVPASGANNAENYTIAGALTQRENWFRRAVTSGGCTSYSEPIKITVNPALANNTVGDAQTICTGTSPQPLTGSAPSGGTGTYTYLWQSSTTGAAAGFGPAEGTNNGQSYTPGNLTQTTWFRRVVTSAACAGDTSVAVQITINQGVTNNSISANQTICEGETPAPLTGSTPTGGTGTYTYLWESSISGPTAGFSPAAGNNTGPGYTPAAITQKTWYRRVVSSAGCSTPSEAVAITVNPAPAPPVLTVRNATACAGGSATLTIANSNGGTYEWFTEASGGTPIFVGATFQTPPLTQTTTYYVQAVNTNGCVSTTRTAATVTLVTPEASAGDDVTIIQGKTVELRASGGTTYKWEPTQGLSSADVANPVASPQVTTTYTVTVTTAEGCVDIDEVTVTVIPAIVAPNAFTPNRDGVNEVWEIENIENYPDVRVEIFNRWGNLVFTSNGYGTPWDGTYNGSDLPVATYYYIIYLNSSERPISGNVTIIR